MDNNPILKIDPDGKSATPPNEYNVDVTTGKTTKISDKGGDKTDYINVYVGKKKLYTDVVKVENTSSSVKINSEVQNTWLPSKIRLPGEIRKINYKLTPGALYDPTAEIFATIYGSRVGGIVLGEIGSLILPSASKTRLFWAGKGAEEFAEGYATEHGLLTVSKTWYGKVGYVVSPYLKKISASTNTRMWEKISERYARGATKDVITVFGRSYTEGTHVMSLETKAIWRTTEFPALLEKGLDYTPILTK